MVSTGKENTEESEIKDKEHQEYLIIELASNYLGKGGCSGGNEGILSQK